MERGSMRHKLFIFLLLGTSLCLLAPRHADANGYDETVAMWQTVENKSHEFSQLLQSLYAEVEGQVGTGHPQMVQTFSKRLAQAYPGSSFHGYGGVFALNGYTNAYFDNSWRINRLTQRLGQLEKIYSFGDRSMEIVSGADVITDSGVDPVISDAFKIVGSFSFTAPTGSSIWPVTAGDIANPQQSRFVSAVIPSVAVSAESVWATKGVNGYSGRALTEILNDTYASRFAFNDVMRMDVLAEKMAGDQQFRQTVLDEASRLYAAAPVASKQPARAQTTVAPPAHRVPVAAHNPFRLVPWYVWLGLGGVIVLKAVLSLSTEPRRGRKQAKVYNKKPQIEPQRGDVSSGKDFPAGVSPRFASRNTLHTSAEEVFHHVLEEVVDLKRYRINGKTRLADLIEVDSAPRTSEWHSDFNRIKSKHVDFVLYEKAGSRLVGVIELDDSSHQLADRQRRDRFVDEALKQAGIPILHQRWLPSYDPAILAIELRRSFGIEPVKHDMSFE